MCIPCLVMSSLMLFMPAPEAAQPINPNLTNNAVSEYNLVSGSQVAQETQTAIAAMLQELPESSDLTMLREGLISLQNQLETTTDDAQAEQLIDESLKALWEQITNANNAAPVIEALNDLLIIDEGEELSHNPLGTTLVQRMSVTASLLNGKNHQWGWVS